MSDMEDCPVCHHPKDVEGCETCCFCCEEDCPDNPNIEEGESDE